MAERSDKTATAMLFERNNLLVLEAFQRGEFDYLEGVGVPRLTPLEHQELVLTLNEVARNKILAKTRRLRRSLAGRLTNPRSP